MIYDMIVLPSHQGKGIGTELLERLINRCKEAGIREIQLFSAIGKAPFYRKRGFAQRAADAPGMRLKQTLP
jgi:GNAT superfamily N-acetyltransferase